ncbi:MAG: hypothetical protein H0V16_04270 [Burkholderiaceae bacterium]|nr:hypothetical protein [Burkholderiaceae bacterium]
MTTPITSAHREDVSTGDRRAGPLRLPRFGAVLVASIIAGLLVAIMEMVLGAVVLGQPWYGLLHMIAAIGMGPSGVLPPPPSFDIGVAAVAMPIHMVLAVIYGLILCTLLLALRSSLAWIIGLIFGIALYYVNFYGFTALFPWFADGRGWIAFVSHAAFGLVLALIYRKMDAREPTARSASARPAA